MQDVRQRVDETGLADTGDALEQHMPARQETRDGQVDHFLVTDDPPSDFLGDADEAVAELIDGLLDADGRHRLRRK